MPVEKTIGEQTHQSRMNNITSNYNQRYEHMVS